MTPTMRVELFGGVRVGGDGGIAPVPNARAGVLIAALVLARGAVTSPNDLRALLWPSGEPSSATKQLHRLVGQVRRSFEPDLTHRRGGHYIGG